jgi:hypothetical protein
MVHPREHARHGELLLGEQRRDQVVLVVARRSDDDVGAGEIRVVEHPRLARVAQHHRDVGDLLPEMIDGLLVLLDQRDVVPADGEVRGDVPPDRATPRDDDAHQWCSPGASSATSSESIASLATIAIR